MGNWSFERQTRSLVSPSVLQRYINNSLERVSMDMMLNELYCAHTSYDVHCTYTSLCIDEHVYRITYILALINHASYMCTKVVLLLQVHTKHNRHSDHETE
jgi:hypothetical protein